MAWLNSSNSNVRSICFFSSSHSGSFFNHVLISPESSRSDIAVTEVLRSGQCASLIRISKPFLAVPHVEYLPCEQRPTPYKTPSPFPPNDSHAEAATNSQLSTFKP